MGRFSSGGDSSESWKEGGSLFSLLLRGVPLELILHYNGNPTESEKKSEHSSNWAKKELPSHTKVTGEILSSQMYVEPRSMGRKYGQDISIHLVHAERTGGLQRREGVRVGQIRKRVHEGECTWWTLGWHLGGFYFLWRPTQNLWVSGNEMLSLRKTDFCTSF